jgi:hypothetical protein
MPIHHRAKKSGKKACAVDERKKKTKFPHPLLLHRFRMTLKFGFYKLPAGSISDSAKKDTMTE